MSEEGLQPAPGCPAAPAPTTDDEFKAAAKTLARASAVLTALVAELSAIEAGSSVALQ